MGGIRGIRLEGYILRSHEQKLKQSKLSDPVVDCVDDLLYKALSLRASDIHCEPSKDTLRIRYRIDGFLYDQKVFDVDFGLQIVSRIKVLSRMDIAERRLPQDGKFSLQVERDDAFYDCIDLRVSTFPSTSGEKIVIRILDRSSNLLKLESLGLSDELNQNIHDILSHPHGFFLVTGPTGSGKTTTLYAMLSELNKPEKNIVTMEDPVEYDLHGITQSQVNGKTGFTFENGLRSMLRQDPDIIMIGEIRDKPTVQIAIESALTGHLVLSTLHTNDAVGAITRLLDMGIESFLISATVSGVLAQRLVRRLCDGCKVPTNISLEHQIFMKNYGIELGCSYTSQGCGACNFLGHRGRIGIFEFLKIDDTFRSLIVQKADASSLRKHVAMYGMKLLLHDALEKVAQGLISLQELWALIEI